VGLSATVTVDTTTRTGSVLAMDTSNKTVGGYRGVRADLDKANKEADAIVRVNWAPRTRHRHADSAKAPPPVKLRISALHGGKLLFLTAAIATASSWRYWT